MRAVDGAARLQTQSPPPDAAAPVTGRGDSVAGGGVSHSFYSNPPHHDYGGFGGSGQGVNHDPNVLRTEVITLRVLHHQDGAPDAGTTKDTATDPREE